MNKVAVRKAWNTFKFHARIAWKRFYRTLCGTSITAQIAVSEYGLIVVSTETGWATVTDFILSVDIRALSVICIYAMGKDGKNA